MVSFTPAHSTAPFVFAAVVVHRCPLARGRGHADERSIIDQCSAIGIHEAIEAYGGGCAGRGPEAKKNSRHLCSTAAKPHLLSNAQRVDVYL